MNPNDNTERLNILTTYVNDILVVKEYYNRNDELHNPEGPAKILYNIRGKAIAEYYVINGNLHRDDGPAVWLNAEASKTKKPIVKYYYNDLRVYPNFNRTDTTLHIYKAYIKRRRIEWIANAGVVLFGIGLLSTLIYFGLFYEAETLYLK